MEGEAAGKVARQWYRPEEQCCPVCQAKLRRHHLLWRKELVGLHGVVEVGSWGYQCPTAGCSGAGVVYASQEAEQVHLKYRRYSRELVVQVGYRRFWQCQTIYEVQDWLMREGEVSITPREVLNLIGDFLALLKAAQAAKIRERLQRIDSLVIGVDGLQPEKGNTYLYVVRELQTQVTLLAEGVDDSSTASLKRRVFEPLKALADERGLPWRGVVSDAQDTIRRAVAASLPGVPHQVCQFHCLRTAGTLTFEADRALKKRLKATLRERISRVQNRIEQLPETDCFRSVLADYAVALRSTLFAGGIAPFELGGLWMFDALADLARSLSHCQKNKTIPSCRGC